MPPRIHDLVSSLLCWMLTGLDHVTDFAPWIMNIRVLFKHFSTVWSYAEDH